MEYQAFSHPAVVAVLIPTILLMAGAFAKRLVRATGWKWQDFYLGVEFALAAISSALLYIFDLVRDLGNQSAPYVKDKLSVTALFLCVTFLLLLYVLSVHQDWEKKVDSWIKRLRLGVEANLIGAGLLAAFVLLVKGTA